MRRVFDNSNNVGQETILERLRLQDPYAGCGTYVVDIFSPVTGLIIGTRSYVWIESTIPDAVIENGLSFATSAVELASYSRKATAFSNAKLVTTLVSLTQDQAAAYIDSNVTNIATAKTVMKIMARILVAMRDELWPNLQN